MCVCMRACVRACMHIILCGSGVHAMEVQAVSLGVMAYDWVLWCDLHCGNL